MNINLRKAAALQLAIAGALTAIPVSTQVEISKFEDPFKVLDEATEKFNSAVTTKMALYSAQFVIRDLLSEANAKAGVSKLLTENADLARKTAFLSAFITNNRQKVDVVRGKHAAIVNPPEPRYAQDHITVGLVTIDMAENFVKEVTALKRSQQAIKDDLLRINLTSQITLPDAVTEVLRKAGLL